MMHFEIYICISINQNCGCKMYGLSIGAIMYADDLVLIVPTTVELQRMINLGREELTLIDRNINVTKSACLRIG